MIDRKPARWPSFVVGVVCGTVISLLSVKITGKTEAWDSFPYSIPTTFVAGIIAALPAPRYWWLAFIGVYAGLFVGMILESPFNILILPIGIIVNALMLMWAPSALGALIVFLVYRALKKRAAK